VTGIPLRIVDRPVPPDGPRLARAFPGTGLALAAGDMWHEPELDGERGECWAVVLPDGRVWRTTVSGSDGYWDVTGTPPALTVSPSINDTSPRGGWHGWIRDGELRLAG
jgi:Family of unknown function (DUF6527)